MSEQNNQLVKLTLPPQQVTVESVRSCFNIELARQHYQKMLQNIYDLKPDKNNLQQVHTQYKAMLKFASDLSEKGKSLGIDYYKAHKTIHESVAETLQPMFDALASLKNNLKTVDDAVAKEIEADRLRKEHENRVRAGITSFINNCTAAIPNLSWIGVVNLQKRIGTELSHKDVYGDFWTDLKAQCDSLTPHINERKRVLKLAEGLKKEQDEATKNNDDEKLLDIKVQLDAMDDHLEINAIQIQEAAYSSTLNNDIVPTEAIIEQVKGRFIWKWSVNDLNLLLKKHPELVEIRPNKEAIDKLLSEKKKDKEFMKLMEQKWDGIHFYKEKYI